MAMESMNTTARVRLAEIDGLRGWAALSVVLFHIFWETFGAVEPGFRSMFTGFILNGELAVCAFFVLSGEALSSAYFAGRGHGSVARLVVKRYLRLTIPILASCALVFAVMTAGLAVNADAGRIVGRPGWLGSFVPFPASLTGMLRYALLDVYTSIPPTAAYNPFLWTMRVELFGSLIVFFLLFIEPYLKRPLLVLGVGALVGLAARSYVSCFLVGMIYAQARHGGVFSALQNRSWVAPVCWCGLATLVLADGYLHAQGLHYTDGTQLLVAIIGLGLVFANKRMSDFFAAAPSRFLGRLSFPLYLVQFPVLISLTSGLIVRAHEASALSTAMVWGVSLASLLACLVAAILFEPVERLTKAVTEWVAKAFLK